MSRSPPVQPEGGFVLVYDIETQSLISEVPGHFREDKIRNLDVSCACAVLIPLELCRDPSDRIRAYEERVEFTFWIDSGKQGSRVADLLDLMDKAFLIVSFNGIGFDALVLRQYYTDLTRFCSHMAKQFDVFVGVRAAMPCEKWPKLDWLLGKNGLNPKEASGLQAVEWWKTGSPEDRAKLASYCLADVNLLAQLALLPELNVGRAIPIPNYCFGVASAVAARGRSLSVESEDERQARVLDL